MFANAFFGALADNKSVMETKHLFTVLREKVAVKPTRRPSMRTCVRLAMTVATSSSCGRGDRRGDVYHSTYRGGVVAFADRYPI